MSALRKCLSKLSLEKHGKLEMPRINDGQVILDEIGSDGESLVMKVCLTELPANAVAIKCPRSSAGYFNPDSRSYTKICDYIVLSHVPEQDAMQSVLIELKKTVTSYNLGYAKKQIKSTLPLLDYMLGEIDKCFKETLQLAKRVYLIWTTRRRLSKRKTYAWSNRSKSGEFLIKDNPSLKFSAIVDAS